MPTLHRTTEVTKRLLLALGIGTGGIILMLVIFQFVESLIPKKAAPPTVSFGVLPSIQFPPNTITKNFTYSINTLTGQLPSLPDRAAVYKIGHPAISLLSLDQAKDLINRNNIPGNPVKISDTLYQWQQVVSPFAKITYDIVTNNFNLQSNYLSDPNVLLAPNLPDQPGAISGARNFFSNLGSDFTDIDANKSTATRLSINNGALVPATSISNTQAIRVDFYQKDLNQIPVYYPHYPHSTIYAIIASVNFPNLIAEAGYYHQSILTDQNGTYPIKSAQEAYNELNSHKAFIANYDGARADILIQNAYLAYFASDSPQDYLLPVIVFQGNDNFYAYVSAIQSNWLK